MGLIEIEGMEFYSFHGHYKEEQVVGNKFILNITIETNTEKAEKSDNLNDALNYQIVYEIIKKEMSKKSFLLENIGNRILNELYKQFPDKINLIKLKVSKINPQWEGKSRK